MLCGDGAALLDALSAGWGRSPARELLALRIVESLRVLRETSAGGCTATLGGSHGQEKQEHARMSVDEYIARLAPPRLGPSRPCGRPSASSLPRPTERIAYGMPRLLAERLPSSISRPTRGISASTPCPEAIERIQGKARPVQDEPRAPCGSRSSAELSPRAHQGHGALEA